MGHWKIWHQRAELELAGLKMRERTKQSTQLSCWNCLSSSLIDGGYHTRRSERNSKRFRLQLPNGETLAQDEFNR